MVRISSLCRRRSVHDFCRTTALRSVRFAVGLALVGVLAGAAPARVLLIAGPDSHGWGAHEHKAGCDLLAAALNVSGLPLTATVHGETWPADAGAFDGVKAVVLYGDGGGKNLLNDHIDELAGLMAEGVGFVCLHYALEVDKATFGPKLLGLLGGYFEANWSVNPMWTPDPIRLANHPITRGVSSFALREEWYYHMRFRPEMKGVTPILSALPSADMLGAEDGPRSGNPALREALRKGEWQHMAWATENENGSRAFGFTGGHFHASWAHDDYRRLVLNAIVWAAGVGVPEAGVASAAPVILRYKTLLAAVSKGDAEDVIRHIGKGADVNAANKVGWTPLHYAAVRNKAGAADALLKHGANVDAVTSKKVSSLHFCAQRSYVDTAKVLIKHGANLGLGDVDGWTPLHFAAAKDNLEIAKLLLDSGADVNAVSTRGGTPLHEGAASAGEAVMRLLLERGAKKETKAQNGKTALDYAIELENKAAEDVLRGE